MDAMLREGLDYDQLKDMDFLGVVTKSRSNTLIQALKNFMDKLNPINKAKATALPAAKMI